MCVAAPVEVVYEGDPLTVSTREIVVVYVGIWKVMIDPEEGSTSCECADHTRWVLAPLDNPRCEHAYKAWWAWHDAREASAA